MVFPNFDIHPKPTSRTQPLIKVNAYDAKCLSVRLALRVAGLHILGMPFKVVQATAICLSILKVIECELILGQAFEDARSLTVILVLIWHVLLPHLIVFLVLIFSFLQMCACNKPQAIPQPGVAPSNSLVTFLFLTTAFQYVGQSEHLLAIEE